MAEPFYFVFATYEEAAAALPSFESDEAAKLREQAAESLRREEESFQRSATDGCVSQWALSITAEEKRREAELANRGRLVIKPALLDIASGQIVSACITIEENRFRGYGTRYVWVIKRPSADRREWITDYKREANFAAKGLRKVYILAPGKMLPRSPRDFTPEPRGMGGLASYSGKYPYPMYEECGVPF